MEIVLFYTRKTQSHSHNLSICVLTACDFTLLRVFPSFSGILFSFTLCVNHVTILSDSSLVFLFSHVFSLFFLMGMNDLLCLFYDITTGVNITSCFILFQRNEEAFINIENETTTHIVCDISSPLRPLLRELVTKCLKTYWVNKTVKEWSETGS